MIKTRNGFTLIELLIVVTIISILAIVTFVSLDPVTQFEESRNARRWADVNNLSTAVYRYIIKNKSFPNGVDTKIRQIGTAETGCNVGCPSAESSCVDLSVELKPYLDTLPLDPKDGTDKNTYYTISKNINNVILITSCNAENNTTIQLSR